MRQENGLLFFLDFGGRLFHDDLGRLVIGHRFFGRRNGLIGYGLFDGWSLCSCLGRALAATAGCQSDYQ